MAWLGMTPMMRLTTNMDAYSAMNTPTIRKVSQREERDVFMGAVIIECYLARQEKRS